MSALKRFSPVLAGIAVLLTGCGGPADLAYVRGTYYEHAADRHLATEDPLSDEGVAVYRQAIDQYNAAAKLRPKYVEAISHRGLCYWRIRDNDLALRDLSEAIALAPKHEILWKERAWVYRELGYYDKAAEDFTQAISINDKDASAWIGRAECRLRLDQDKACFADLDHAMVLAPKNIDVYAQRAMAYRKIGAYDKMDLEYEKTIGLKPHDPDVYQWMGYSHFIIGSYKQAIEDMQKVRQLTNLKYRSAPYTVILATLSCRLTGKNDDAADWLDSGVSALQIPVSSGEKQFDAPIAKQWPNPVVQYLHGDITADRLIASAANNRDRLTEVNCYLALCDKLNGKDKSSAQRFKWIVDHGTKTFVEYEVALNQLAQHHAATDAKAGS